MNQYCSKDKNITYCIIKNQVKINKKSHDTIKSNSTTKKKKGNIFQAKL